MVFGFVMGYTSIFCFTLLDGPFKGFKKLALFVGGVSMVLAMVYSGTRAAYVLLPVGLFFYAVITFKTRIMIIAGIIGLLGLVVINVPNSNPNLVRFQTAFRPNEDESYKVRKRNQAFIQPYIQTHPIGGGLGSVGVWGEKFSPGSPLSKFPPDSGYVRIAVEMGWVGLGLYCYMLFVIMKVGLNNHFRIKDPKIKAYSLSLLTVMYVLIVANFPQEAIGQIPTSLIFFIIIALLNKLRDFDKQIQERASIQPARLA
jgi:O-antigen ligase